MKEYIERDAALKNQRWNGRLDEYVVFVRDIEAIPAADVAEVRHGKWDTEMRTDRLYERKYPVYACSLCGIACNREWDYCPNCGAKMDGGVE